MVLENIKQLVWKPYKYANGPYPGKYWHALRDQWISYKILRTYPETVRKFKDNQNF